MTLQCNPSVVAALLSRFTFGSTLDLQQAADELSKGIRLSMEHTTAYSIPLDQQLPPEATPATAAPYLHPLNIATALVNIAAAGQLAVDPALLVYNPPAGWVALASEQVTPVQVTITQPAPPPPPPPPAPAPPPPAPAVAPPPPPMAAPAASISDLVDAAINGGTPAAPAAITTPAEYDAYRQGQGHPPIEGTATRVDVVAPAAVAATPTVPTTPAPPAAPAQTSPAPPPVTQHVTLAQARAEADNAEAVGLPDASIMAERRSTAGRPQKSPFEREVKKRNKIAPPPFWWGFLAHSAKSLFVENPAQALDPSSTGAGPIQAYALLVALQQEVLRCVDGNLTVAELRAYLRDIDTAMSALPSKDAIYQLASALFSEDALKGSDE